jgi:AraC family transcriptional regulator, regulatory protein of adaptative response / methylated-DNA-[protein]-cysteine methyltransferase
MAQNNVVDHPAYQTMEEALYHLAENAHAPPSLKALADRSGLSEFHFQKMFTRWVGISPKRFSQYLSKEYIKTLLNSGMKPLDACYQAGLSGPGRMHELFINTEAMSPAQYRSMGKGLVIHYGIHDSPFGTYLIAATEKGICQLNFIEDNEKQVLADLETNWGQATLIEDPAATEKYHRKIFADTKTEKEQITLLLKGTNFQIQVWQALLKIPFGEITTYEEVANLMGKPSATRASASAIARNNIAWLIPCHRVVRKIGDSGQYRWGAPRKKIILGYEGCVLSANT